MFNNRLIKNSHLYFASSEVNQPGRLKKLFTNLNFTRMKKKNEKMVIESNANVEANANAPASEKQTSLSTHREMNVVELCGYVGFDPEIQDFASGKKKIRFKLATHYSRNNSAEGEKTTITSWFPVVVWGKTADEALAWLRKGNKVKIKGYLSHRTWEDKDGIKRNMYETVATELLAITA